MRIGFIGLGVQGLPLALNLVAVGHEVYGFDVDDAPLMALARVGGQAVDEAGELAVLCEVIFICVATDAQVLEVVAGEAGLVRRAASDIIIVNHGTVSVATTTALIAATEAAGIRFADVPVSGGARGAEQKTMSFMVGADDEVMEICEPLFRASGSTILRVGGPGAATVGKLAHQVAIIGNILAMAEAMRLGVAGGLEPDIVKAIIAGGLARSWIAETWGEIKMAPHALPIYAKDLENSLEFAQAVGADLPGARLMRQELHNIVP